jgi:translation elongation factor EF-Ts
MPSFTPKDVQSLRRAAGVGMLDAKRALEETGGVMEDAVQWALAEAGQGRCAVLDVHLPQP